MNIYDITNIKRVLQEDNLGIDATMKRLFITSKKIKTNGFIKF